MSVVNPYLTFDGNCSEAFDFYRSVFGGEFATVMRFSEMPGGSPIAESLADRVMHIAMPIGTSVLMGSDTMPEMGPPFVPGNNFTVAVGPESEDETRRIFDGLASGGITTMPLNSTFWGALFGMLTDKFGVQWMVNFDLSRNN